VSDETTVTVVGNLVANAELRFTASGAAVANFTVASTPRIYDRQSGEWKDGDAVFIRCCAWRELAENVAETLTKGARVIVTGRLKQRSYEARDGEKRRVIEVEVEDIGPFLRYSTAKVSKQNGRGEKVVAGGGSRRPSGQASEDDPWSSAPSSGWPAGGDDKPPF